MPNNISVVGRLTNDPEVKTGGSGKSFCLMSVADNYGKEGVIFHNVIVFNEQLVNFCSNHLKKGYSVLVSGRLEDDSFEAQDGTKVRRVKVVAHSIDFAMVGGNNSDNKESKNSNQSSSQKQSTKEDFGGGDSDFDDDIPF